ncbi:MAG: chemotaxis protein CheW [Phycisphaerae bacterium]|nr:chemotaxis protein CheW [Phycisphaerae bacterium]
MDYNFFLLTTFLLQTENSKTQSRIRCLGSREILKVDREIPKHILGVIEFESAHIPVVDLAASFGVEPISIDNSRCVLIIEQDYQSGKLYTGIILRDIEEIGKLAAGIFEVGTELYAGVNLHFVIGRQNSDNNERELLVESHKILSLLEESKTEMPHEHSRLQLGSSYNFMNALGTMDFLQRQVLLEELANEPELWDRDSKVMCL